MKTNGVGGARWFQSLQGVNPGAIKLFCFPHAGGSAQIFRGWQQYLSPGINVCLAHLPGKGPRIGERPFTEIKMLVAALADAIIPHIQGTFALWGHSMGALVCFELARELQRRNQRGPLVLVVSGRGAPPIRDEDPPAYNLPDEELLARLRGL
jgi:surfactin synthase thioesterase subunit